MHSVENPRKDIGMLIFSELRANTEIPVMHIRSSPADRTNTRQESLKPIYLTGSQAMSHTTTSPSKLKNGAKI